MASTQIAGQDCTGLFGARTVAIDVETTSFDRKVRALEPWNGHRAFTVQLAWRDGVQVRTAFWRVRCPNGPLREVITLLNALRPRWWAGANVKFDCRFLHQDGVELRGDLVDTRVLSHMRNEELPHDLKFDAAQYLGDADDSHVNEVQEWMRAARSKDFGELPTRIVEPYARQDATRALLLAEHHPKRLDPQQRRLWRTEVALTRVLLDAELRGVKVDLQRIKLAHATNVSVLLKIADALSAMVGWDVDPTRISDVEKLLCHDLELPVVRVTEGHGKASFDSSALEIYINDDRFSEKQKRAASLLLKFHRCDKLVTGFLEPWQHQVDDDNVLHPEFNQVGTRTGRLSCSHPNLQQVASALKPMFIARPGFRLLFMDYSQIEFRVFAHYSRDQRVFSAYRANPDVDFHRFVAELMSIERKPAKTINFGLLYGMGIAKLAASLGVSIQEADRLLRRYHQEFVTVRPLSRAASNTGKRRGYVRNLYGRRRHFPDRNRVHHALNSIIQGTAGDLAKKKAVEVASAVPEAKFLINVHDELVWEVPDDGAEEMAVEIRRILETVPELDVPVRTSWKLSQRWE